MCCLGFVRIQISCSMRDFFLSLTQLCSVVVIALILLVLLFIAPLFFHLPKVRKTIANEIIPSRHSQPKIEVLLSPLIGFGAKLNDVTE